MNKPLTIIALFLLTIPSVAQKTVQEWAGMEDKKFFKKMSFTSGAHHVKKLVQSPDEIPELKNIGALGFSIISPVLGGSEGNMVYRKWISDKGSQFIVDQFYDDATTSLTGMLKEQEVALSTPDQYVDSEEKQQQYAAAEFIPSKMWNTVIKLHTMISAGQKDIIKGTADGMKFIGVANADPKVWREVGKFAGDMGLDAVLVVETSIGYDGKTISLGKITASIIGPNSVPYREEQKKLYAPMGPLKGYLEGINYGAAEITAPSGALVIARNKKGSLVDINFEGIGQVYARIVTETLRLANEKIDKMRK